MEAFLRATPTIDSNAESVQSLARELADGRSDDETVARDCFIWVRDNIRHTGDYGLETVTCSASETLHHGTGFCYAKSHLLAALLRANGIPAALCYQRLVLDAGKQTFCLHGMVAVHLRRFGWYRIDPRGNKQGVKTDFSPPVERLAFEPKAHGEMDVPGLFEDAIDCVESALRNHKSASSLASHFPDQAPTA